MKNKIDSALFERVFEIAIAPRSREAKALLSWARYREGTAAEAERLLETIVDFPAIKILGRGLLDDPLGSYLKHEYFQRCDCFKLSDCNEKVLEKELEKFLTARFSRFIFGFTEEVKDLYRGLTLGTDLVALGEIGSLLDSLEKSIDKDYVEIYPGILDTYSKAITKRAKPYIQEAVKMSIPRIFSRGRDGSLQEVKVDQREYSSPCFTWAVWGAGNNIATGSSECPREAFAEALRIRALPPSQFILEGNTENLAHLREAANTLVEHGFPLDRHALEKIIDGAKCLLMTR